MKKILSLLLILAMAVTLLACTAKPNEAGGTPNPGEAASPGGENDDLSYILDKGVLIIGITPYEPMNYEDENGKLVGFDTEFAEAVCALNGIEPEFKWIDWNTKEIELKAKNIDAIWNGLTVTEERRGNMAFTTSYLKNEQAVVIRADDADKFTDLESLKAAVLVAEDESAGAAAITSDLSGAEFSPVVSQAMALLEVKSGTADAAVIDYTMARAMTGEGSDYADLMIVSSINMMPEEYAIGLRLNSTAVDAFNESIAKLIEDGTLAALSEKYGVEDLLIK